MTLRWGDSPALSRWTQHNQKGLYKQKGERGEREPERWQHDQRLGQTLLALKIEDGDHEPRTMDGLQMLEKAMKQVLP